MRSGAPVAVAATTALSFSATAARIWRRRSCLTDLNIRAVAWRTRYEIRVLLIEQMKVGEHAQGRREIVGIDGRVQSGLHVGGVVVRRGGVGEHRRILGDRGWERSVNA